jgi:hypothetical protein
MGIRLRAGRATRRFEPGGDPLGTPQEIGEQTMPYFSKPRAYTLPSVANGQHSLIAMDMLKLLLSLSHEEAIAIVRAARLYQDALWLAESEPALSWLLLVSALETAATEWQKDRGDNTAQLQASKPELYEYLNRLNDNNILPTVAGYLKDSLGITKKFVDFLLTFLPEPPEVRPAEWAQFNWTQDELKRAFQKIYDYRSKALHTGRPFPMPMCEPQYRDPSWQAPAERMTALGASQGGGTWLQKDIPMYLHLFEHIARNALVKWWRFCEQRNDPIKQEI